VGSGGAYPSGHGRPFPGSAKRTGLFERPYCVHVKPKVAAFAVAACVVAAGVSVVALAAVRTARNRVAAPSPNRAASGQSTSSPTVSPSGRTFRQALGPACLVHEVHGDFDGDRLEDVAFTWMPQPVAGCPSDPPFRPFMLTVFLAHDGERVELQMTDRCDGQNCGYVATADLNGDAKSELAAITWTGASTDRYRVFELIGKELVAIPVAPPGTDANPPGAPIELVVHGSALNQYFVTCEEDDYSGGLVLLAHGFAAETDEGGQMRWTHSETAFRFDGRAFIVIYQDPQEVFPDSYDPAGDRWLRELSCWPMLP
jgi:hypothetical protein